MTASSSSSERRRGGIGEPQKGVCVLMTPAVASPGSTLQWPTRLAPAPARRGGFLSFGCLQLLRSCERANRIWLVLAEASREQASQQLCRLRLTFERGTLDVVGIEQPTRRKFLYLKAQVSALTQIRAKFCGILPATPSFPELPADLFVAAGIRARHFDAAFKRVTVNVTQLRHALRAPLVRNTTSTPVSPLGDCWVACSADRGASARRAPPCSCSPSPILAASAAQRHHVGAPASPAQRGQSSRSIG